jgi:hypothetical protein
MENFLSPITNPRESLRFDHEKTCPPPTDSEKTDVSYARGRKEGKEGPKVSKEGAQ